MALDKSKEEDEATEASESRVPSAYIRKRMVYI